MEDIYSNYRNIIERAIFSGIITEDSRHFYLSAIEEENESELSELESRVNMKESANSNLNFKQKKENFDMLQSMRNGANNKKETAETRTLKNEDCQSLLSGSSIENYSILDIKSSKDRNDFTEESDSDMSSVNQERVHLALPQKLNSSSSVTKVVKKPKYQIIDFNVPIYMSIKKDRPAATSLGNNYMNSMRDDTLSNNNCKSTGSKVLGTDEMQSLSKRTLSKSNIPVIKIQGNGSKEKLANFINFRSHLDKNYGEINANKIQQAEKSQKKKSVHTCPQPESKRNSEAHAGYQEIVLNEQKVEQNNAESDCVNNQKHKILRLKVHSEQLNQEHAYKIKHAHPTDSDGHQDVKKKTRNKVPVKINDDKCKNCRCNCVCKSLAQFLSVANSTDSDDKHSVLNLPMARSNNKKKERSLNFNIICQFYQEEEKKKQNDVEGLKNANGTQETQEKLGDEVSEERLTETRKTKRSGKIQHLSKIFTNMKINRKQKQSDYHS